MNLPTTKHALVIQGTEQEKQQACIKIRDWAVKNGIPMYTDFIDEGWNSSIPIVVWSDFPVSKRGIFSLFRVGEKHFILDEQSFTIHHTVESFMKVFKVEESNPQYTQVFSLEQMEKCFNEARTMIDFKPFAMAIDIEFKHKDFNEYKSTIQEFNPIELTNPKN